QAIERRRRVENVSWLTLPLSKTDRFETAQRFSQSCHGQLARSRANREHHGTCSAFPSASISLAKPGRPTPALSASNLPSTTKRPAPLARVSVAAWPCPMPVSCSDKTTKLSTSRRHPNTRTRGPSLAGTNLRKTRLRGSEPSDQPCLSPWSAEAGET